MLVDICGVRALIYKRRIMYIMYSLVLRWGGFGCFWVCVYLLVLFIYLFIFVRLFYLMWFWLIGIRLVAV